MLEIRWGRVAIKFVAFGSNRKGRRKDRHLEHDVKRVKYNRFI